MRLRFEPHDAAGLYVATALQGLHHVVVQLGRAAGPLASGEAQLDLVDHEGD